MAPLVGRHSGSSTVAMVPAPGRARELQLAAVLGDHRAGQHHAQAVALGAGGEERRAQLLHHRRRHPLAGVAHAQHPLGAGAFDLQADAAAAGRGLQGVGRQVQHRLLQPPPVARQHQADTPALQAHAGRRRPALQQGDDVVGHRRQIHRADAQILQRPGEAQVVAQDALHAGHLAGHHLQALARLLVVSRGQAPAAAGS